MITDCSDPREVSDFHFLQLKTLKLAKGNERVPAKALNVVAAASKYGLIFIGIERSIKVLKLQDIVDLDEGKENKGIEENYSCTLIPCGIPLILALNASQTILAVCVDSSNGILVNLYDLSTFIDMGHAWQPFYSTSLSSQGIELRDFTWNPVIEGLFAYCLSDGSLHILELSGMSIKSVANVQEANAVSVSWSPKGKQLVVGKNSGQFTQYKPNLQEVKTVEPPILEESPVFVSSICWISTTTFAVVYVAGDSPNLFIVSTPKDAPVTYVNFYDVCLGNNGGPSQKYFMHLEPTWGILICASIDSIEVAVLGDMPNWMQWDLKEDGKALLPGKDGATHAIGMAVIYSAQKRIIISESEAYPPMPIIFFLTNNGLLVPFHMINAKPDVPSLVAPPIIFETKKECENERTALKRSSSSANQLIQSGVVTAVSSLDVPNHLIPQSSTNQTIGMNLTFGMAASPSLSHISEKKDSSTAFGNKSELKDLTQPRVITTSSTTFERNEAKLGFSTADKENDMLSTNRNSSYMIAIMSEIQNFTKELQDLKKLHTHTPCIDGEEAIGVLRKLTFDLQDFQTDIAKTMQFLSNDIFVLKNVLLENFVMVEEAYSRERRKNDHSYITMLKERALDPITAKRMQKMNQHYQYLNTQLQEVSDKLDQDWRILLSRKKHSVQAMSNISSTEAIYKTIVNNQKIIYNLRKKLDILCKKMEDKNLHVILKRWGRSYRRSAQEDLYILADEFLQVKVTDHEEREPPVAKKLSAESQNALKSFLKESNVITVRPTIVYSPSQSRLLSNAVTLEDTSMMHQRQKQDASQASSNETFSENTPKNSKIESAAQSNTPIYEPITPPEASKAAEHAAFSHSPVNESRLKVIYHSASSETNAPDSASQETSLNTSTPKNVQDKASKTYSKEESPGVLKSSAPIIPLVSSSGIPSKTLINFSSFDIPKSTEFVLSNSTSGQSFTTNTSLSGFQFASSLGQEAEQETASFSLNSKWASIQPVASTAESSITVTETKNQALSGVSMFNQLDKTLAPKPNTLFNVPASTQNISFSLPATIQQVPTITKSVSASSPLISGLEIKTSSSSNMAVSNPPQTKSTSFDPKLCSTEFDDKSPTQKDDISSSSSVPLLSSITIPNISVSETDNNVIIPKLPNSPNQIPSASDEPQLNIIIKSASGNSLNEIIVTPVKDSGDNITLSNQSTVLDSFSDLSILKQPVASSESSVCAPQSSVTSSVQSAVTTVTSSVQPTVTTVTSSVQPTVIVNTSIENNVSFTSSLSAPVVSSTISSVSQPNTLVSTPTPAPASTNFTLTTSTGSDSLFGTNTVSTTPVYSSDAAVAVSTSNTTIVTPVFGAKPASSFGQAATETSSFFGNATSKSSVFGQTSAPQNASFGQPVTSSGYPTASSSFFSQPPSFGTTITTSSTDLNNQASAFSFGKSAFGQANGSFGLAKSLFGQTNTPLTQPTPAPSFSFGQSSTNVFGQGPFFGGLGGKPSEENANKNVFSMSSGKSSTETNVFGSKASSFTGSGSFSSGGNSVAQSGFGAFQQSTPQKPGAFGSPPSFGGAPSFGSPPAFGAPPAFGTGNPLTAPVFGQQQMPNFSSIANANSPTFGTLASQNPGGFVSSPPMGGGFGSPAGFGNSSFGNTSFGGFGNQSSPPSNSSAFSQWRN